MRHLKTANNRIFMLQCMERNKNQSCLRNKALSSNV